MLKSKIIFLGLVLLSACSQQPNSKLLLMQEKCASWNETSLAIRGGSIINKANDETIGTIKVIDHETVSVTDTNNETRNLKVVLSDKVPNKRLLVIMRDDKNILLACGID